MLQVLIYSIGISFVLNMTMYAIAYKKQTDKLTDISYSVNFMLLNIIGFALSERSIPDILVFSLVTIWAFRLGGYLLKRIHYMGKDDRFDQIRENPKSFFGFWIVQAFSVGLLSFNFLYFFTKADKSSSALLVIGCGMALLGWLIEAIADGQKFKFKKSHPDTFIATGLWKRLRHPNYTGEILFWVGVFVATASYFNGIEYLTFASPLWIIFILLKFSGIPPLEKKWEERYGNNDAWLEYKRQSWKLVPFVY